MKLRNRFKDVDKLRVWVDHPFCCICNSNQGCSLHHIAGCKNKEDGSIYNSSMLCYSCHKEADAHNTPSPLSKAYQDKLREYTYNLIQKQGYINTPLDEAHNTKYNTN